MDIDTKHLKNLKVGYFKHFAYATYYNFLALLIEEESLSKILFNTFKFTKFRAKFLPQ